VVRAAAARFATSKITDAALDVMTGLIDDLERGVTSDDPEEQLRTARRFDELLLQAADNDVLGGVIGTLSVFGWTARIRAVRAMHDQDHEVGLERIRAHREILAALRSRDPDRVESRVREHLADAIDYILAHAH
jgi:DNA-binding GntR family transcriptional regulator